MNRFLIAIALFVCWSDAAAAVACRSSPGTDDYYQYRLIDGKKCWYRGHTKLEKSALGWKSETRRRVALTAMVAGEAPGPSTLAVNPGPTADHRQESSASASASRRGEPAPDFDGTFSYWPQYAVARPVVHLLYPPRVSQAWGSKRVAVVVYRREP